MEQKPNEQNLVSLINKNLDKKTFEDLHWKGSFEDYLTIVKENPNVIRNAFQRLYNVILTYGTKEYTEHKEKIIHYNFFDDPDNKGEDAIFGLDKPLMEFVDNIKAGADYFGVEKRILLLHGPVGSSKSTIVRLLKKSLENYSKSNEGKLYTFSWRNLKDVDEKREIFECPMHEDPLKLIPIDKRDLTLKELITGKPQFDIKIEGDLCPACRYYYEKLMEKYSGDWSKVVNEHIEVKRLLLSEKDRIGIGTFQPKDEKNQDSTELTGDINFRKIAEYGSDSDPRAFNFDGELNIANRGLVEFIEILKLDVAFLYDLLGASQEHSIKPRKFPQTTIDEVILGHTNNPEFEKLKNNEYMEAFRDRTVKINIPYVLKLDDEIKIYKKTYEKKSEKIHIAPHTIEMAAMWAILTRLEELGGKADLMQKLKLYNGKAVKDFTSADVKELKEQSPNEGMKGISPRFIQNCFSSAMVSEKNKSENKAHKRCIDTYMVLNEILQKFAFTAHNLSENDKDRYKEALELVKLEYENVIKSEVQKAITADEAAIENLFNNYVDNVKAFTQHEKMKDKFTGEERKPDENLMKSIEDKMGVDKSRAPDHRREFMNYIGAKAIDGEKVTYKDKADLQKALEQKLFEDRKDTIRLSTVLSDIKDKKEQEKIDVVKQRLMTQYGYCEVCATDVLNHVASIFARGDVKE